MNSSASEATPHTKIQTFLSEDQKARLTHVSHSIAPTWPLDQMIAVNPYWELRGTPFKKVNAKLAALASINCYMPKAYYQNLFDQGAITPLALKTAVLNANSSLSQQELEDFLKKNQTHLHCYTPSSLLDQQRADHTPLWSSEITRQISQFCAAHYQTLTPILGRENMQQHGDLYEHWLEITRKNYSVGMIMDAPDLHLFVQQLPQSHDQLLAQAIATLELPDDQLELCSQALLLSINGWAAWLAYLRWQGNLYQQPHDELLQLLAIRFAWELVLWNYTKAKSANAFTQMAQAWSQEKTLLNTKVVEHEIAQEPFYIWASAAEISYQHTLNQALNNAAQTTEPATAPELQAIFCIDVRSEVIRRALEAQSLNIQTSGFAGFFGLPLEYSPQNSQFSRPQLPGLLKPDITASKKGTADAIAPLSQAAQWQAWSKQAPSTFSMVESVGWLHIVKTVQKSFFPQKASHPVNDLSNPNLCAKTKQAQPHQQYWSLKRNGIELTIAEKATLAHKVLKAMNLTSQFAPVVLFVGHGSASTNNLHGASLDCGACGGQTGEINVQVLAEILNNNLVRTQLDALGIAIPKTTLFYAALHNTTTDFIDCFEAKLSDKINNWLASATQQAQRERIALIDASLKNASHTEIHHALTQRSQDWSQVRPEWGLANNAAFIIAPRALTRGIDLQGRSFLHDYVWQMDEDFSILELILTAPMIVTNWINMQYNASTTDNKHYGSGNKVLHNAVGGNIGVFEGNGGDLRTGLSIQSLHDGQQWMHQPQRLSVYVSAPREPIAQIASHHANVQQLIDNEWLYLLRITQDHQIERFYQGQWILQKKLF